MSPNRSQQSCESKDDEAYGCEDCVSLSSLRLSPGLTRRGVPLNPPQGGKQTYSPHDRIGNIAPIQTEPS